MKANILLVDDRAESLLALEAVLEPEGQTLVKARSGEEALRHVLDRDFAVILLDVQMPGLDGFETAALIRQRPRSRDTPIIFLTAAHRNEAHIFQGYAAGAVDYLLKPIVPEILRSKVAIFVELARKNETLKRQAEELAAANKELEAFSYSVSHDLRGPLRGIDGFSQMLLRRCGDQLGEEGRSLLARQQASAQRMARIIDDLLKLARVTRKELDRSPVDLSAVARVILKNLERGEPERKVRVEVQEGVQASGDPGLLLVLMENLLGNAWKFSGRREESAISFGVEAGPRPVYFVRDNGAGFDMADAARLFGVFTRLHGVDEFPGTGIGLATAQRIVLRHGGRIWAQGAAGEGAVFRFSLEAP